MKIKKVALTTVRLKGTEMYDLVSWLKLMLTDRSINSLSKEESERNERGRKVCDELIIAFDKA